MTNGQRHQQQQQIPVVQPTELVHVDTSNVATALVPTSIEGAMTLAKWLASSTLLPPALKGKEPDIFMIVMAGMELGLPPMAALRGIYAVNGRTALEAKTKASICLKRGAAIYFKKIEDTHLAVTWETLRQGDTEARRSRYTLEEAKAAGMLNKDGPWKQYTQRMLSWRALGFLCDDAYPDVVLGIATAEDFEPEQMTFKPIGEGVAISAPVAAKPIGEAPVPAAPAAATSGKSPLTDDDAVELLTAIGNAGTEETLKEVMRRITAFAMTDDQRAKLRKACEEQLDLIRGADKAESGGAS